MKPIKQNTGLVVQAESRLKQCQEVDFKKFLNDEIYKLFVLNGQNAQDPQIVQLIRNEVYRYLNVKWPGIKAEWIQKAFVNGINGEYGNVIAISYKLLIEWINKYRDSMNREDFGIKEDPMPTKERASFVLDGLRKRNSDIAKLDNKGKEALKRKLNKKYITKPE